MGSSGGAKRKPNHPSSGQVHEETMNVTEGKSGLWGALAGLFTFALIAVPLSAAFSFATHPNTQQLFAGRLEEMGQSGYVAFWWVVTIFLLALPFLVGYAIARLSGRSLAIVGGIIALFVIAILVMGQMFVF
jgi:amino acid transporter